MTPAKIYPFSIPAGGSFPLLVIGDYCKILTSSGPLSLTGDTFGTIGPILAGQGVENSPFQRLVLVDNTGNVNNGTILIADNAFIDDRITGEVSVIDGGKVRTLSQKAFCGQVYQAALAGQYSQVQLWNPAGSGANIIVESFSISSLSATSVNCSITNSALTTSIAGLSKLSGGSAGIANRRSQNTASLPLNFALNTIGVTMPANGYIITNFKEPMVLLPGYGFTLQTATVNTDVMANFEWYEEVTL